MAKSLWEPDGTQPPPADGAWEDPVSGLVTGAGYQQEPFKIDLVQPVQPDMDEVRRRVDAVLSVEDEKPLIPSPRRQPAQPIKVTPGAMPPNPRAGWPRGPAVRQLSGLRPRRAGGNPATKVPRPPGRRRPQGSSAGWVGLIVLLVVFVVLAVTALGSLANTISALFD